MSDTMLVTTSKPKIGGAVHRAPLGTKLPTDAVSVLDSTYVNLGYISDSGLTNANSKSYEQTRAWGGDIVDQHVTENNDTFQASFIESNNVEVLKMVFGDNNVTGDLKTGITIVSNAQDAEAYVYVVDMIEKGNVLHRVVLPNAKLTERGDTVYSDGDVTAYDCTLSAMSDELGNTHYEYKKKKEAAPVITDKTASFKGDGVTTVFTIDETKEIKSVKTVAVNGTTENAANYTVDLTAKTVTFTTAPANDTDIIITYTC